MSEIKAIVTDIEGTTSSISFVHEVLFPYAAKNLEKFIEENRSEPFIQKIIYEVLNFGSDGDNFELNACSSPISELNDKQIKQALELLQHWIRLDMKIKPLKDLQGLIWEAGYKNGDFKGHIYEDAYIKLKEWHDKKIPLYIYSSGSVHAQKLLFGHTEYGDLNYLFSGNFDTKIGGKKETKSYHKIIDLIASDRTSLRGNGVTEAIHANEILFLSDIEAELDAAAEAGMQTIQLIRPGSSPSQKHIKVEIFDAIDLPI